MDENLEEILAKPDSALAHRGSEISEFTKPFIVAILLHDSAINAESYRGNGTGVLLRIQDKYFILTAGHCVKAIEEKGYFVVLPVERARSLFCPDIVRSKYIFEGKDKEFDYGYIEITKQNAITMESRIRVFMSLNRIEVLKRDDLLYCNDWFVISGFPDEEIEKDHSGSDVRFFHATVKKSESKMADIPDLSIEVGKHTLDLLISLNDVYSDVTGNFEESVIPCLAGMSGGGCWKTNLYPDPYEWDTSRLRLVATHCGTLSNQLFVKGKPHFFVREMPIGHHLHLICTEYKDLAEEISNRWPYISTFGLC